MDSALVKEGSRGFGVQMERRGPGVKPFLVIESMLSLHARILAGYRKFLEYEYTEITRVPRSK